jgi:hypothetical protein
MTDVVGPCVGPTWRWGGWPLFHDHDGSSVAPYAIGYIEISIRGYGLSDMIQTWCCPPREDWDQ